MMTRFGAKDERRNTRDAMGRKNENSKSLVPSAFTRSSRKRQGPGHSLGSPRTDKIQYDQKIMQNLPAHEALSGITIVLSAIAPLIQSRFYSTLYPKDMSSLIYHG